MRKGVFIVLVVVFSSSVMAALECEVKEGNCSMGWTKILGLTNYTNAHVELADLSSADHNYSSCCTDDTYAISATCGVKLLGLNETTNSHVEKEFMNSPDYPYDACMNAAGAILDCLYANGSCPVNYECVLSLNETLPEYPNTSMHVASCNESQMPYDEKLCCKTSEEPPPEIPEFGTIGMIVGIIIILAGSYFIINKKLK